MCVVAVKYLKEYGWVGAKNRDRNYKVHINIVKSNRNNVQRLYIDDALTRWTEGCNEHGIAILSSALSVKNDEKEGEKVAPSVRSSKKYSPQGLSIRKALLNSDIERAVAVIAEAKVSGCTYIFNRERAFLMEGGYKKDSDEFHYIIKELTPEDEYSVRTNHGVLLPYLGYSSTSTDQNEIRNRKSSESRRSIVAKLLADSAVATPADVLAALSATPKSDIFMNPIRKGSPARGDMLTTGQLLLVPHECTLHYRPIYCSLSFDYSKINGDVTSKVFFEVISARQLLSFKKHSS